MHQTWLPNTIRKPLPIDPARDPRIQPVGAVFHIAVSEADSLFGAYRGRTDGIESHGYIRRQAGTEQYRPLDVECDAQFDGNSWVRGGTRYGFTSWESQGQAAGQWTDYQLTEIKRVCVFHHDQWGVPLRLAPAWDQPGFGYHRLFEQWNHNGHTCPGDLRVQQFHDLIVPWLARRANPPGHKSRVRRARELLVAAGEDPTRHARGQHFDQARELLTAARDDRGTPPERRARITSALELLPAAEHMPQRDATRHQHIAKVLAALPVQ